MIRVALIAHSILMPTLRLKNKIVHDLSHYNNNKNNMNFICYYVHSQR